MAAQSQKRSSKPTSINNNNVVAHPKPGQAVFGSSSTSAASASAATSSLLSKALTPQFNWADKDEFLDVIYWMRQILGLVLGLVWGIIPLKGFLGLALFLLVNVAIVYIYYNSFQKIDEEEYGGTSEILKEGLMTSFSSFLVAWIILYSALYSES